MSGGRGHLGTGVLVTVWAIAAILAALYYPGRAWGTVPFQWPPISLTEAKRAEFTVTRHYNVRVRPYEPPVLVRLLEENPGYYGDPEAVVIGLLSAIRKADYNWWLSIWDKASRDRIAAHDKSSGISRAVRVKEWQEKIGTESVFLYRWVESGPYVIVTYRRSRDDGQQEQAVALKLADGEWVATLDLIGDPVLRFVATGQEIDERTVR